MEWPFYKPFYLIQHVIESLWNTKIYEIVVGKDTELMSQKWLYFKRVAMYTWNSA